MGTACWPEGWLAVLAVDASAMSSSNCVNTGWLRCVSRASRISLFADLLLWLQPTDRSVRRIGRIVGDQERNKSSYSQTRFDIHPRERRTTLNKCQIVLATGGTVAQDLTMQWSAMRGFMQELSLMVIDEGQQYGTDREIAVISLLQQQPLIVWTGDAEQTPGGIARTAPNANRSRQLLLAKKHGLRSARQYFTPATLANAMTILLSNSSNSQLVALADTINKGEHTLGQMWTEDLQAENKQDLADCQQLLPGATGVFRAATPQEKARRPSLVDAELLDGTAIDFRRSLIRLAYILQHAATLHPMAGDLQATLNSETAGISNIHSWGLMLPSSSRVSPVTYHAVVAVRYPSLCRIVNGIFFLQRLNCSRKVVMQVFTRCVNSAVEADAVISFWFVVHANDMIPR